MARYPASGHEDFSGLTDGDLSQDTNWTVGGGTTQEPQVDSANSQVEGDETNDSGSSFVAAAFADFSTTGYNEVEIKVVDVPDNSFESVLPLCHLDTSDTDAFIGMLYTGTVLRVIEYTAFGTFDDFVDTGSHTLAIDDIIRLGVDISGGTATIQVWINTTLQTGGDFSGGDATFATSLNPGQPGLLLVQNSGVMAFTDFAASDAVGGIDPASSASGLLLHSNSSAGF